MSFFSMEDILKKIGYMENQGLEPRTFLFAYQTLYPYELILHDISHVSPLDHKE